MEASLICLHQLNHITMLTFYIKQKKKKEEEEERMVMLMPNTMVMIMRWTKNMKRRKKMKHVYGLHVDYKILRRKKKCCNNGEGKDQNRKLDEKRWWWRITDEKPPPWSGDDEWLQQMAIKTTTTMTVNHWQQQITVMIKITIMVINKRMTTINSHNHNDGNDKSLTTTNDPHHTMMRWVKTRTVSSAYQCMVAEHPAAPCLQNNRWTPAAQQWQWSVCRQLRPPRMKETTCWAVMPIINSLAGTCRGGIAQLVKHETKMPGAILT